MKLCLETAILNKNIKPKNIFIMCHGLGGSSTLSAVFASSWAKLLPNTIIYCPQAPHRDLTKKNSYQWFDAKEVKEKKSLSSVKYSEILLDQFIDEVSDKNSIENNKIILGGFSQGCMMSLQVGIKRKKKLNSILGYSGSIIDIEDVEKSIYSRPDIYLFHGDEDNIVKKEQHTMTENFLKQKGFKVSSKIFKKCSHNIPTYGMKLGLAIIKQVFYKN